MARDVGLGFFFNCPTAAETAAAGAVATTIVTTGTTIATITTTRATVATTASLSKTGNGRCF